MRLLILAVLSLFTLPSFAGHIIGGEMYYDYLGGNNYRFHISMYKDCDPAGNWADFDNNLILSIYSGNIQVDVVTVPFPGSVSVPVAYNNPCVTPPPGLCILNAVYEKVLNLPPTPQGYTVSYQRCCRKPQITNINNPGDTGFTLTSQIPGTAVSPTAYQNSSPRFTNYPPSLLCNNDILEHDQSATDPDGDQLVYSFVTPFQGGSSFNPQPTAVGPPYYPVSWVSGHSATQPLGPGSTISIDPNNGFMVADPNMTGLFVIGIQVKEIRNGVVISTTLLDYLFQVFACSMSLQALLPTQEQLPTFVSYCQGLTVDFVNNSWGTSDFYWDFGDGVGTSTAANPSYTYPQAGIYEVTLVANPSGAPCSDTAHMIVNVNNVLEVEWEAEDSVCLIDNSIDFVANVIGDPGYSVTWDFGPNGNPQIATGMQVNGVEFTTSGYIPVTVEAELNVCFDSYTDSIFIFAEPESEMVIPDHVECEGLTIQFGNSSTESDTYYWDFGVPGTNSDVSTDEAPTYTYPGPGTYTVTLIAGSSPQCMDTADVDITINEDLVMSWTSQDSLCITGNSFDFDATVSGPPQTVYTWNFGSNASITTSNDIDVNGVSFSTPGSIQVSLTGAYDDCSESVVHTIYLWSEPTIDFGIAPGLQCAPYTAHFIDMSSAETTIYYDWDFGDGNSSTEQNPYNTYYDVGLYPVTLTIHTDHGCIDTLTLTQQDLVHVRPNPVAGFAADPVYTDICHSTIVFTDESEGATAFEYWFDDWTRGPYSSGNPNPTYQYISSGDHRPLQVVTNEWGCQDSTREEIYIEPYTIYAPNTFTPDGNQFNNVFLPVVYLGAEEWKLEIFDRWGERLFESHDINVGWDGTIGNGKIAQDGTYVWKITYKSCEPINPERIETGHINLLR